MRISQVFLFKHDHMAPSLSIRIVEADGDAHEIRLPTHAAEAILALVQSEALAYLSEKATTRGLADALALPAPESDNE